MTDRKTGLPFKALSKTDSEGRVDLELSPNLNDALFEMYKSITLEGTNKQNAGAFRGPGSVGNKYGHHRFLIFKDGESWLKYHKRFGDGEPFDIMMGHITNLSRDIALMEIFGPNPNAGVRYLQDVIKKNTAELKVGKSAKIQKQIEQEERSAIFLTEHKRQFTKSLHTTAKELEIIFTQRFLDQPLYWHFIQI